MGQQNSEVWSKKTKGTVHPEKTICDGKRGRWHGNVIFGHRITGREKGDVQAYMTRRQTGEIAWNKERWVDGW